MTTTHHAISVAAGAIQSKAADLCALGPALSAERLLIGVQPSALGGWWK